MSVIRLLVLVGLIGLGSFAASSQVTVNFTADQTEGCGSLQVNFCDNSSSTAGSIVAWSWSLGGVTSTNECQGRIFGSPGAYEICLTVTDSDGNTGTNCEPSYITVFPLPQPDFIADPPEGCIPHTSSFTYTGTPNITEYIWGLGGSTGVITTDGGSSPDAESTYSIADQFDISLTVTDDKGCSNFISKNNYIKTYEPTVVQVSANQTSACEPPFQVSFSNDNIQPNMEYIWDLGNGVNYAGDAPPPVWYTNSGSYTITVIGVNSSTDCRDTIVLENYINIGFPIDFSFTPDAGCEDLSVSFSDNSPEVAGNVLWDFGDGTTSTDANPNHIYQFPGIYTINLTRTVGTCTLDQTATTQIEVFELPNIAYNNDNTLGCSVPHSVNFDGISTDGISWLWDFGDGTTSTQQSPNHVYTNFGNYPVSLTVTNANGCESIISTTTIEIVETEASITDTYFSGCAPLNISLSDNSVSVVPVNNWVWEIDLPSGTLTSSLPTPNFSIPDTGCFSITLTVTNILGCSHTQTYPNAICTGTDPLPNFEAIPVVACIGEVVSFTDLSSPHVDLWNWDFSNSLQSTVQNPTTSFTDTGFYDITLLVADKGCVGQITLENYIQVTAPKSIFSVIQNCENYYNITTSNVSIEADSFFWDFGDLTIDTDTSSLEEPTFTYAQTGTYDVTLTTFNFSTGCSHIQTHTIYIHDPLSLFTISATEGCIPMTVSASNSSLFAAEYEWTGVGMIFNNPTIANPNLLFNNSGSYTDIQLVVTDVNGCRDTSIFNETIFANEVTVDFTPDDIGGCQPFEVTFTENASNLFANNTQWDWDFEGGGIDDSGQTSTYTFENTGLNLVSLTVTDDWGCVGNLTLPTAVEVTAPTASFTTDTLSCTAFPISFINTSSGLEMTYSWDFGDGNSSTDANPTHQYIIEGTFTPCLTVTDKYGCSDNFCLNDFVIIADPQANFSLDTSYASCPPLVVNFENNSINATSYIWDFGDGSGPSDLENPGHVYTIPGTFDVTLIATSTDNCVDTFIIENLVVLDGPLGSFHFDVDSTCLPTDVTFYAESQGSFMYVWDFGNGTALDTVNNVSVDTTIYTYMTAGNFTPKLGIIDQAGCQRILESPTDIFVPELTLGFQATDSILCDENNPITFLNLINSTGNIDSLEWQFAGGNPAISNEFEPTVTFDLPGKYDVTLIAHNAYCSDTLLQEDFVRIGDVPNVDFIISEMIGCEPLEVTFTDNTNVINGSVDQWHWEFGDGFESYVSQPTHTYFNGTSFDAQLTVTTDVGCVDSASQTIQVMLQPEVTITADQIICIGETTQLLAQITSDPTGVNYFWENSPTLSCTNCLDPIANPVDTTIYTFVAISAEGCETRTDFQINVRPFYAPTVVISNDTLMCANDLIQLFVDGGDDIFSYSWDQGQAGLSCYENCINPIASPSVSTTYTVTVTTNEGCSASASVFVDVINQNQSFAGEDRTICLGDTAQLHIGLGNDPLWIASDGLDCSACYDAVASPQATTDFVAQVTTNEGCYIVDTVRVNVLSDEHIDAGEDFTLCREETALLNGQFLYTSGNLNTEYNWTPSASLDNSTLLNPEVIPSESATYILSITSGDCILRDSVHVEVVSKTEIEAIDKFVCEGDSVTLEIIGSADNFEWIPAEGLSDPSIANPSLIAAQTATYTVIATLASCDPDTATAVVQVNEIPGLTLPKLHNFFAGTPVLLDVENATSDFSYSWFPTDGLTCSDCSNPTANVSETTVYTVTITDLFTGCQKTISTKIELIDECSEDLVGVPNAFTPNEDGENDLLDIKYSSALVVDNYKLQIFDRWGSTLYESTDINEKWDGTVKGKAVPAGVVIYFLEFPCHIDGSIIQKKGDITILR